MTDIYIDWDQTVIWWRHQMETFSASLAVCSGNSLVTGEFPTQRPMTRSFDVFFHLINNWVNNRNDGDLRRYRAHYDVIVMNSHRARHTSSSRTSYRFLYVFILENNYRVLRRFHGFVEGESVVIYTGPLFTKRAKVLPQDLVKSQAPR